MKVDIQNFINWLSLQYVVDISENNEYVICLVYTKSLENFHENFINKHKHLNIEYHYPKIIITANGNKYIPGVDEYDKDIEFITLKINL